MRKSRGRRRRIPPFIALTIIGLIIVLAAHLWIPYNDDEFIAYWATLCRHFPGNASEEMCALQWLRLPLFDVWLPLRSFLYIGTINDILYFPLYLLWPSPMSARFFCMIFLALQVVLYGKLFRRSPYLLYAGLVLFFPYFFQHLVDTGPIVLQTTSVPVFLLLVRRWAARGEWWPPLAIGLMTFLCIWSKLTYFWFLPPLAVLAVLEMALPRGGARAGAPPARLAAQAATSLALLLLLVVLLLFSRDAEGSRTLWNQIVTNGMRPLGAYLRDFFHIRVVHSFLNPLEAAQRVFLPFRPRLFMALYDVLLYAVPPLVLIFPAFFHRDRRPAIRAAAALLAFLMMVYAITRSSLAAFMHHAVLSYPFLIVAFLEIVPVWERYWRDRRTPKGDRAALTVIASLWIAVNLGSYAMLAVMPVRTDSDRGRAYIYRLLNDPRIAERYVVASSMWGTYFEKALYGPRNQSVLYLPVDDHRAGGLQEVRGVARRSGRSVLLITMNDGQNVWLYDAKDVARRIAVDAYGFRRCEAIPTDSVWQVYAEDDGRVDNPCFPRSR